MLPRGVKLLNLEDNKKAMDGTPFSWWIKWDTLHWYDADGAEQEVEGDASQYDYKRPQESSVEVADEEEIETS